MASESESNAPDQDRPAAYTRMHSGLENLLPASITQSNGSKSRARPSARPQLERSISSMTDSFILEHWGSFSRSPYAELEGASTLDPLASKSEDGLTPISNWAHLSYIKKQRNALRVDLKAHQIADAEAKRSVTSLRRLAFRMAVNISIKEKQLATSAINLATSRKLNYLEGKDTEKRLEELKRALRIEEWRNREIVEALERASMLTLQYSTAKPQAQHRRQCSPLSPPPSPPTRLSNPPERPLASPRPPTRPAFSPWHDTDWGIIPSIETPSEIRTADSGLIRAKRASEQALAACRSRIEELHTKCAKSREDGRLHEITREGLEQEIQGHQCRITTLEQSTAAVEETLKITRLQLNAAIGSEETLLQALKIKEEELSDLERTGGDQQQALEKLQKEKDVLEEALEGRHSDFNDLEIRTVTLEEAVHSLQDKLEAAERHKSSLCGRLVEKESVNADLSNHVNLLQQQIDEYEAHVAGQSKKIEIGDGVISELREEFKKSGNQRKITEDAFATLKTEVALLQSDLRTESDARDKLVAELKSSKVTQAAIEHDFCTAKESLQREMDAKTQLRAELERLHSCRDALKTDLTSAQRRIQSLEGADAESWAKLESALDAEASLEADLQDARQLLFRLREQLRMSNAELVDVESTKAVFQQKLQASEDRVSSLERELDETHTAEVEVDKQYALDLQKSNDHLRDLEASVSDLQASLKSSENLEISMHEELQRVRKSKNTIEGQLGTVLQSEADLQIKINSIQSSLVLADSDRQSLEVKVIQLEDDQRVSSQSKIDLEARLSSTQSEREMLQKLVLELETALQESSDAKTRVEEALTLVQMNGEASGAEVADLHDQLGKANATRADVERRLHETLSVNKDVYSQLHTAQSRLAEVETNAHDLPLQLSTLRDQAAEMLHSKEDVEERLKTVRESHSTLDKDLKFTQSRLQVVETTTDVLRDKLSATEEEAVALHRHKALVDRQLEEALETNATFEKELTISHQTKADLETRIDSALTHNAQLEEDLNVLRSRLNQADTENIDLCSKLTQADDELSSLRQVKDSVDEKLSRAVAHSADLKREMSSTRSRLEDVESQHATLTARLTETDKELAAARYSKADVEEDLRASQMRLGLSETKSAVLSSKASEAVHEINALRDTNAKLEVSEKGLLFRLTSAEKDLDIVRETNARLEAFLERVETDMATAEAAIEESERRLEEFVEMSQAKLDATRISKLKYKKRSYERDNENKLLINENSELQHQIGEQTLELATLKKGNEKLVEELSDKEKYISELGVARDKRMKSMNSAYNKLRNKYEEQVQQQRLDNDHDIADHLGVLEEWQEPAELGEVNNPHHVTIEEEHSIDMPSSPLPERVMSSSPIITIRHPNVQSGRPTTGASADSREEDLDAWAGEVERVRMLRDEQAIKIKNMKRESHDLKKSLKNSEAQLHRLEKHAQPKRHRTLLKKSRPSAPLRSSTELGHVSPSPPTPRPTTSGGFSFTPDLMATRRHSSILLSSKPDDRAKTPSPPSESRRWSTPPRPTTSHRPATSHSFKFGELSEPPITSGAEGGVGRPKHLRRWSSGLRNLFKGEH